MHSAPPNTSSPTPTCSPWTPPDTSPSPTAPASPERSSTTSSNSNSLPKARSACPTPDHLTHAPSHRPSSNSSRSPNGSHIRRGEPDRRDDAHPLPDENAREGSGRP